MNGQNVHWRRRGLRVIFPDFHPISTSEKRRDFCPLLLFKHLVMSNSLQPIPGLPVPHHLPEFAQVHVIASVMPSSHLIFWCSLLLLPSIFPIIRDFSNESSVHIRWPNYWSFSLIISPSSEYSELIFLKIYWLDLFAVQGTFRSLLQHHSLKASVLWCSSFSMVQLSQPYVTTGKMISWTIWTFVGRVMSLLFNTLSRFVIAFRPRSSHLLIASLQSPSTVILETKKRKSVTTSSFFPSIYHEVIFSVKPALSLSSFTLIKRVFSSFSLSAIRVVSSTCLRLLMFLQPILSPACNSSNLAFLMMCSEYRLNKQGDSRQPYRTPFFILNQSVVSYRVLTVTSWPAYRFLKRQVKLSGIPISLRA